MALLLDHHVTIVPIVYMKAFLSFGYEDLVS